MKSHVIFECDSFNTTEQKPEFVNPDCFGDDLLSWLATEIRAQGEQTYDLIAEDWGWILPFTVAGQAHWAGANVYQEPPYWLIFIEQQPKSFWKSLFGKQKDKEPTQQAVELVHVCLTRNSAVRNIRWHDYANFSKGIETAWTAEP